MLIRDINIRLFVFTLASANYCWRKLVFQRHLRRQLLQKNIPRIFAGHFVRLCSIKAGQTYIFTGQCPMTGANIQACIKIKINGPILILIHAVLKKNGFHNYVQKKEKIESFLNKNWTGKNMVIGKICLGNFFAEANPKYLHLPRQKPRHMPSAEANFNDC